MIREEYPDATEDQITKALEQIIKRHCYSVRKEMISIDSSVDTDIVRCTIITRSIARSNLAIECDNDKQLKTLLERQMRYYADKGSEQRANDYKNDITSLNAAFSAREDALRNIDVDASSDLAIFQNCANSQAATLRQAKEFVENE